MNKEIKLLKRVRDTLSNLKESHYDLYWDIQAVLDKPNKAIEIELLKKAQNILHELKTTYYVHVLYWDIKYTLEAKHD